jgi:acyl dehydratase
MAGPTIFQGIDGLRQAVGTHLGYSNWHTVTQRQIDLFAEATGDHQWIHVDPSKAAAGPFGSTIAHGYLTLSLVPMLVSDVYEIDGVRMGVNYGVDKVRFPAPVPVGSELRAGIELLSVEPGSGGYRVSDLITIERKGSEKPVCVVEALFVMVP